MLFIVIQFQGRKQEPVGKSFQGAHRLNVQAHSCSLSQYYSFTILILLSSYAIDQAFSTMLWSKYPVLDTPLPVGYPAFTDAHNDNPDILVFNKGLSSSIVGTVTESSTWT